MSTRQGMYSRPRSDRSDTASAKTLEHDPARFCRNLPEPARSVLEPFERSGKWMQKALYSVTVFPRAAPADIARTRSDSVRTGTAPKNNDNMTNFHELIEGFRNFREDYLLREAEFFETLKSGQNPRTLVVACCDSRVDPALLTGCRPGDLFVVRNVAALVPACGEAARADAVMAAVEYGVKHLEVEHVIVMGHSNCGGIHGLMHPEAVADEDYIAGWLEHARPVLHDLAHVEAGAAEAERSRRCEEAAILLSIENLLSYPWIQKRVTEGVLKLHALYYDMHDGNLLVWDAKREDFVPSWHFSESGRCEACSPTGLFAGFVDEEKAPETAEK